MRNDFPRILYFIKGSTPNKEEFAEAMKLGPNVTYRNVAFVDNNASVGSLEKCDGVAGAVPEIYAKNRPSMEEAAAKFEKAQYERWAQHDKEFAEKEQRAKDKAEAKAQAKVKADADKQLAKVQPGGKGGAWQSNQ